MVRLADGGAGNGAAVAALGRMSRSSGRAVVVWAACVPSLPTGLPCEGYLC